MTESEVLAAVRLASRDYPSLTLWRNNSGATLLPRAGGGRQQVRYGLVRGAADLIGVLGPSGRFVAIEAKSASGRVSPEQAMFLALVRESGGLAGVVRSVEDFHALMRANCAESLLK